MVLANELLRKGQFQDAHVLYRQLFALQPNPDSLYGLAVCEFEMRHIETALETLDKLLEMYPAHSHALNLAGVISLTVDDTETARLMFEAALMVEEGMIENAAEMGGYFLEGLRSMADDRVKEIRGRGLLIGMEFKPEAGGARQYCEKLMRAGILCKETHDNIIRFAPPLVITRDEVEWALGTIRKALF